MTLMKVQGRTRAEWAAGPRKHWDTVGVAAMLLNDWEVLPKIDSVPVTV